MQLDPKTRHTLQKAIPALFEAEYARADTMAVFDEIRKKLDFKKYKGDKYWDRIIEQTKQSTGEQFDQLISAILEYTNSDDVSARHGHGGFLKDLFPIAWGVYVTERQARILERVGRPFNKPEGVYRRERDKAIRKTDKRFGIFGGDYLVFTVIAQVYRGQEPWKIKEDDL